MPMSDKFNSPDEVRAFLDSNQFAEGFKEYVAALLEEHQATLSPILESISDMLHSIARAIPPEFAESIVQGFTAPPEELKTHWTTLAEYGWFPDPSLLLGAKLFAERIGNDTGVAEQLLADLFRRKLPSIENELVELYPQRRHLLSEGFEAHRQEKYGLSILMFLAQADGIIYDQYSKGVFSKPERKNLRLGGFQEQPSDILASFLLLFDEDSLPIWATRKDRSSIFCGFNRHQVMHGESVDYNTKENSLKAVSLLSWLACVNHLRKRPHSRSPNDNQKGRTS